MNVNGDALKHRNISIPSLYEYIKALVKNIVGSDNTADAVLVLATLLILGVIFLSFRHALQNYTVIGAAPF